MAFVHHIFAPQQHLALSIFYRRHLLHDFRRYTHRNAPSRNVFSHDCTCRDRTTLSDGDAGQDHHVSANPTVITNYDRLRVFDVVASRLHLRLVCSSHDRHIGPEHHGVANGDQATVQDREVEVGVEAVSPSSAPLAWRTFCAPRLFLPVAQTNVAAIIHSERWLDDNLVSDMSQQLFQLDVSLRSHGVEGRVRVIWKGVVVFVAPAARFETGSVEFGRKCIVAVLNEMSVLCQKMSRQTMLHILTACPRPSFRTAHLSVCV